MSKKRRAIRREQTYQRKRTARILEELEEKRYWTRWRIRDAMDALAGLGEPDDPWMTIDSISASPSALSAFSHGLISIDSLIKSLGLPPDFIRDEVYNANQPSQGYEAPPIAEPPICHTVT